MIKVAIGIQARSTSERFPGKVFEIVGSKTILQHILDNCESSVRYLKKNSLRSMLNVSYHLLIPKGDRIKDIYGHRCIEGDEHDVLSRYTLLQEKTDADYIVRITGDCPLLPDDVISKAINLSIFNKYDYCSNVQENARTSIDGFDVEVMSKRALKWAHENAQDKSQREHVTIILRSQAIPSDYAIGHMIGRICLSNLKFSVDTPEDLKRVREQYSKLMDIREYVKHLPGKNSTHNY